MVLYDLADGRTDVTVPTIDIERRCDELAVFDMTEEAFTDYARRTVERVRAKREAEAN